jgi:predicted small metal-binding protein
VSAPGAPAKTWLQCPCGETIKGANEEELVERALAHLRDAHPDLANEYGRDHILFMAR